MFELDDRDELFANGFTTLTHHEGLYDSEITNGHGNVDGAGHSEALGSHPLRNPLASTGKDIGEIETVTGATRPRLLHITRILSEDDPGCPAAVEATNTPNDADTLDRHDSDDILHIVCSSPYLKHVISHKNSTRRFPLGIRWLHSLCDTVCRLQLSGVQISYGRQTQYTSVPNSSYLGIVRVVPSEARRKLNLCQLVRKLTFSGLHL